MNDGAQPTETVAKLIAKHAKLSGQKSETVFLSKKEKKAKKLELFMS